MNEQVIASSRADELQIPPLRRRARRRRIVAFGVLLAGAAAGRLAEAQVAHSAASEEQQHAERLAQGMATSLERQHRNHVADCSVGNAGA